MAGKNIGKWSVKAGVDADGVSIGCKKMGEAAKDAESKMKSSFDRIAAASKTSFQSLRDNISSGSSLGGFLGALGGGAIGSAFSFFSDMTGRAMDAAGAQQRLQREFGLTGQAAAGLVEAGATAGIDSDSLTRGLEGMAVRIGELRSNLNIGADMGAAGRAMDRLGINVRQFVDLPINTALGQLGDRLNAITNPSERIAAAHAILGHSWREMLPLLNQGSAGLAEAAERAVVLSNEEITSLRNLRREQRLAAREWETTWTRASVTVWNAIQGAGRGWHDLGVRVGLIRVDDGDLRYAGEALRTEAARLDALVAASRARILAAEQAGRYVAPSNEAMSEFRLLGAASPDLTNLNAGASREDLLRAGERMNEIMAERARLMVRTTENQQEFDRSLQQTLGSLRMEIALHGLSGSAARIRQLELTGASAEQIRNERNALRIRDAQRAEDADMNAWGGMYQAAFSPMERFNRRINEVNGLADRQQGDDDTRNFHIGQAINQLGAGIPEYKLPGGLEEGGAGAVSTLNQNATQTLDVMQRVQQILETSQRQWDAMVEYNRQAAMALNQMRRDSEQVPLLGR